MGFYFSIAGVFGAFAFERILGEKERKRLFAACLFFLWLLTSLRATSVGNDTVAYQRIFLVLNQFGLSNTGRYEFAYVCLNLLVGFCTENYTVFLAVESGIVYLAFFLLIERYGENGMLTLLMFLLLGFWAQTASMIRMELALAMVVFALLCREDRRFGWMLVFAVLAPLFQKTSVVYLLGLFLPKRIAKWLWGIILIGAALVSVFLSQLMYFAAELVPYFSVYLGNNATYELGGVTVACLFDAAILAAELCFSGIVYRRNCDRLTDEQRKFFALGMNMGIVALAVTLIAVRFNLLDRCSIFFNWFVIILLPNAITWMKKREDRLLATMLMIVVCASCFAVINSYRPEWNHIIPYRSVLWP